MGAMLDKWHDMYHTGTVIDLVNCPHCQDEYVAWAQSMEPEPVDRLEDIEV